MDNLAHIDDRDAKIKTELIDGKIFMMSPAPTINHGRAVRNISRIFSNNLVGKPCESFVDGVDVFLDDNNRFKPDVMIVCDPNIVKQKGIYGAPDLVVEVLSQSTAKNDKSKKKYIYAKAGVKEYWLVDTWNKSIEVYYNQNNWFVLDHIYYLINEETIDNNNLVDNDKNDYRDSIVLSIGDKFSIKIADVFERL